MSAATARRALRALRLSSYRNYDAIELTLDARPVVLFGANGAGKTNAMEAVSCLAPGRGLRRAKAPELARRVDGEAAGPWAVSADLDCDGTQRRVGVGQDPANPSRRLVRIDGEAATQSDLARLVRVVWLTPAQDRLFAGSRSERLRYLDRLVLALRPDHAAAASAYERAMRERTRLLEEGGFEPAWLDGLEREMALHGVALSEARVDMLARLQRAVDARPDGAFPKSDLALSGGLEERLSGGADVDDAQARFGETLAAGRRRDAAAGRALDGPHRADLLARHRANNMPAGDCSTGEQKALLVGLALAHARALEDAAVSAAPLLLLDEAAAHLDAPRRAALMDEVCDLGAQAWLTGTDIGLFDAFDGRAQLLEVTGGVVSPR